MKFIIIDQSNYHTAIQVQREIFPHEDGSLNILASLDIALYKKMTGEIYPDKRLHYWLAENEESQIVGITGLYVPRTSDTDIWLGWFGVKKEFRGKGYGKEILRWTIRQASKQGFTTLRLYTDSEENDKAVKLYKSLGFIGERYTAEALPYKAWIYSLSLTNRTVVLWENKNLDLNQQEDFQNLSEKDLEIAQIKEKIIDLGYEIIEEK